MRGNTFFLFNRFSLIGGIVLTLVLPFIPIYYRTVAIDSAVLSEETFQIGNAIIIKMKVNEVTDIGRIITLGYFSGIMFLMLSRGWSIFRLLAHISKGIKTTVSGFTLVESVAVSSSFSFLHYIVLPQGMNEVDKQVILTHEKTHVRQHHYIDLFLGDIFCIIQWFNPFAWFYKRDMIENHEFLADRAASHVSGMDVYKDTLTRYWLHEKSGESFCIFHQTDAALHVEKAFFINGSQVLVGVSFAFAGSLCLGICRTTGCYI
jgi:hypothetical protein